MYTRPVAVGGKLVTGPIVQASAGLGELDVFDLPIGELGPCAGIATGASCRGVELGGVLARCTCVNLTEIGALLELKQLVTDVTGMPTKLTSVWTVEDEAAFLTWVEADSGVFIPDVRRPWRSGYVAAGDIAVRTASGWAYPTGAGILGLADRAGLVVEGGPNGTVVDPDAAQRFPIIGAAIDRFFGVMSPSIEEALRVYPPAFGASGDSPDDIHAGDIPSELVVRLPAARASSLQWLGWSLAGAAIAVAAWRLTRRSRA